MPRSTGETGQVTVDNTPVEILAAVDGLESHIKISNFNGAANGFFSIRGAGGPYTELPKGVILAFDGITLAKNPVHIKRVVDGANMTEVYCTVW